MGEESVVIDATSELRAVPLFRSLDADGLRRVAEIVRVRHAPIGKVLFRQGDVGNEMLVLLRGSLRITAHSANQESPDLCVAVATVGEVIGELALLDGGPRSATVTTEEDCTLLSIARDPFIALMRREPDIAVDLLKSMAMRLRHTTEHASDIAHLNIYQRLVRQLKRLALEHGHPTAEGTSISHPVPIEMLAAMVAAHPAPVERLVAMLESDGVLRYRDNHIVIHDVERLSATNTPLMY